MRIKGYKVFDPNWTCNGKQYTCPGTFQGEGEVIVYENGTHFYGTHFCLKAVECFRQYPFDPKNHVAEVIVHRCISTEKNIGCTDNLEIVREITWQEVLDLSNMEESCTMIPNPDTGNKNKSDNNTGVENINCYELAKAIVDCLSDGYDDEEYREEAESALYNELSQISNDSYIKIAFERLCERIDDLES